MLPQLREIEQRFPHEIAIVGVHSGKFTAERETAAIRDASVRLNAIHPTINDRQFRVWRAYAVRAWPTLVVIDPNGRVIGQHAGEFTADGIAPFLERVIGDARREGALQPSRVAIHADPPSTPPTLFRYPGKVAVDGARIAIADSGNHRVLLGHLDDDGRRMRVERTIGGDAAGYRDGVDPLFHNPQGLCFHGDTLFVADAGNHAIRAIVTSTGASTTLAGTGRQARAAADLAAGALASPWDIVVAHGALQVAMAGRHQLWSVDLVTGSATVLCGSGAEALHDGTRAEAALAQPMGLCLSGDRLYVADSESSAIREVDLTADGGVRTIVGTGLFDFGDADGVGDVVRLQHPQAVVATPDGRLLVADSYNGALKWIDPAARRAERWIGGLSEPSGLAVGDARIYVAECNQHRIAVVDRATGTTATLVIER